jgi:hypothetical protein
MTHAERAGCMSERSERPNTVVARASRPKVDECREGACLLRLLRKSSGFWLGLSIAACGVDAPYGPSAAESLDAIDTAPGDAETLDASTRDAADIAVLADTALELQPEAGTARDAALQGPDCALPPEQAITNCTADAECVIQFRPGCCGGTYYAWQRDSVAAVTRDVRCPTHPVCGATLGCQGFDRDESGRQVSRREQVEAICVAGRCTAQATTGRSFSCGTSTCQDTQYCEHMGSGTQAQVVRSTCKAFPSGCASCACLPKDGANCREAQGGIHLEVLAP